MAGKFEPKTPVQLDPPKDDPISLEDLAKASGMATHFAQGGILRSPNIGFTPWFFHGRNELTFFSGEEGQKCYVAIKVPAPFQPPNMYGANP